MARPVRHRLVHVVAADGGADGRVARAEPLGRGDDVGHEWQVIGGEPLAGSAHASDHLVEADQEAVLLPAFREPLPEELWGRVGGQSGGADRLAEER